MAVVGAASFVGGLAESFVLVILTLSADALIRKQRYVTMLGWQLSLRVAVLVALVAVGLRVIVTLATARVSARFGSEVILKAQEDLLAAYIGSSHSERSTRPPGDLSIVVVNHGRLTGGLGLAFTSLTASIFSLLAFVGSSLVVNPVATVGIALIGGVVLAAIRPVRARSRAASREYADTTRALGQEATEVEALHREIEVFKVGHAVRRRAVREAEQNAKRFTTVHFYSALIPQVFQAALLGAAVLSLLFMVGRVGEANLAAVGAVVLLLIRSMSAAQQVVTSNQTILETASFAEGVDALIARFRAGSPQRGSARPDSLLPVVLCRLEFSYDGVVPVLNGIDVELSDGELVGVVGPSGAGKSTLVELLLGLRTPTGGHLLCGGVELKDISPEEFARRVAFVPQDPILITGSVAENVDFFRSLPESRIMQAIKDANLEAEIEALPEGIHTRLGPNDRSLSGGQRQRLTIARALAGDPEIVILDEPTSALDAISEAAIRRTLSELPAGRLVIVIAHRYSTLKSCTRILALHAGKIESDATPDAVAEHSNFFRAMVSGEA